MNSLINTNYISYLTKKRARKKKRNLKRKKRAQSSINLKNVAWDSITDSEKSGDIH